MVAPSLERKHMNNENKTIICIWPVQDDKEAASTARLNSIVCPVLAENGIEILRDTEEIIACLQKMTEASETTALLFVLDLGTDGINPEYGKVLRFLRRPTTVLPDCPAGVIVDCDSEHYTKAEATCLVQAANEAGLRFPGSPLVEATKDLKNFAIRARNASSTREEAYAENVRQLLQRLRTGARATRAGARTEQTTAPTAAPMTAQHRTILALHASSHETSNTFALFDKVKRAILQKAPDTVIEEVGLRNGTLQDCSGCPYKMCLHFGENASCFYGGVMVEEVYPALKRADTVLMICPNYNDALSANLVAFINRLSALYRVEPFYDKALFAIIVSGYSGGDILARQLISALNMNKGFVLPPRFALMERAMEPGEAMALRDIDIHCSDFAENILESHFPW